MSLELCGGLDNDCDGRADESCIIPEDAVCEDGEVPILGCYCGGSFYRTGFCISGRYRFTWPGSFPWIVVSIFGAILLLVLGSELIYNKNRGKGS